MNNETLLPRGIDIPGSPEKPLRAVPFDRVHAQALSTVRSSTHVLTVRGDPVTWYVRGDEQDMLETALVEHALLLGQLDRAHGNAIDPEGLAIRTAELYRSNTGIALTDSSRVHLEEQIALKAQDPQAFQRALGNYAAVNDRGFRPWLIDDVDLPAAHRYDEEGPRTIQVWARDEDEAALYASASRLLPHIDQVVAGAQTENDVTFMVYAAALEGIVEGRVLRERGFTVSTKVRAEFDESVIDEVNQRCLMPEEERGKTHSLVVRALELEARDAIRIVRLPEYDLMLILDSRDELLDGERALVVSERHQSSGSYLATLETGYLVCDDGYLVMLDDRSLEALGEQYTTYHEQVVRPSLASKPEQEARYVVLVGPEKDGEKCYWNEEKGGWGPRDEASVYTAGQALLLPVQAEGVEPAEDEPECENEGAEPGGP